MGVQISTSSQKHQLKTKLQTVMKRVIGSIFATILAATMMSMGDVINDAPNAPKESVSDYCDGWEDGYCEGWKDVKGQFAICPIAPICPIAEIDCSEGYRCGYNRGFKAGMKAARN